MAFVYCRYLVFQNAAVVMTVVQILLLYIPLVILCRHFDKKDKMRVRERQLQTVQLEP